MTATHPALRILKRIDITEPGCWIWPGSTSNSGYGCVISYPPFSIKKCTLFVHRVMYQWFIGEIPAGLELDHLCRVRLCCNPTHLEPVPHRENIMRGAGVQKDACPQGHDWPEHRGRKRAGHTVTGYQYYCRACAREYARRKRELDGYRARQSA